MARFRARTHQTAGRTVIALDGECDLQGRDELTAVLLAAVRRSEVVVADLAGVTFIDSSGVHALITAHHTARAAGRRFGIRNATGPAATVLDVTGVGELLAAGEDTDD